MDRVLVDGDADVLTDLFCLGTSEADGSQVPQDAVVIGTVSLQAVAFGAELGGQYTSVGHYLLGVRFEFGPGDLEEGGGDGRDGVIVGSTLAGGKYSLIDTLLEALDVFTEEDKTGMGSTEGLVAINASTSYHNK